MAKNIINKLALATTGAVLSCAAISANSAQAATFTEIGDIGETLGTVQALPGNINVIQGTISPSASDADIYPDADIYSFYWGGGSFYATTVGGADFDTLLALFDSSGTLLDQNDDSSFTVYQSTLNQILSPGQYLLGISSYANFALSSPIYNAVAPGFTGGSYSIFLTESKASVASVPEPITTLATLAIAAFGLAFGRKQKTAAKA